MTLDFIFHGGADLNAKMYHTDGFADISRMAFEKWHLKIEGNLFFQEGRFLELPVPDADARLAVRTFWVKEPGRRAECFYLGVRITKDDYREAGDYYRLISAIRSLSFDTVKEVVRSGRKLVLTQTMPMHRQSMWVSFAELSGTRRIGAEKFEENLEDVLLSVSVNNIDDWFDRMYLAIDPAVARPEFNVIVSKSQPKSCMVEGPFKKFPQPRRAPIGEGTQKNPSMIQLRSREVFGSMGIVLVCGIAIIVRIWNSQHVEEKCVHVTDVGGNGSVVGFVDGRKEFTASSVGDSCVSADSNNFESVKVQRVDDLADRNASDQMVATNSLIKTKSAAASNGVGCQSETGHRVGD